MDNYTPKKPNFLKQLFTKNNNTNDFTYDDKNLLNYYSSLAKYHPDLSVVLSPKGEVLSQNRSSINEFMGYSPRKKLNFKEHISKDSYTLLNSSFKNTLKGESETHEVTVRNRHNQVIYAALTFFPIK